MEGTRDDSVESVSDSRKRTCDVIEGLSNETKV